MDRRGISLIEVVVALLLLAVGVLAYAGSAALVTRLTAQGRAETVAARIATSRVEHLVDWARATSPTCLDPRLAAGSARYGVFRERWQATGSGSARSLQVVVEYPRPRGRGADTTLGLLGCGS